MVYAAHGFFFAPLPLSPGTGRSLLVANPLLLTECLVNVRKQEKPSVPGARYLLAERLQDCMIVKDTKL